MVFGGVFLDFGFLHLTLGLHDGNLFFAVGEGGLLFLFDLGNLHLLIGFDLALFDRADFLDLGFLYEALGVDLGLLRFAFALRRNGGNFGALLRLLARHFLVLMQGGKGLVFFNRQTQLRGLVIFLGDGDRGILLDLVAFPSALLCLLRQLGQTFGVEGILRIKIFDRRLI